MPPAQRMSGRLKAITSSDRLLVAMLLPIARLLLRHGIGIGDFFQAAKQSYVEAAIAEVTPVGRKPNVSRLSVVTGLTRKDAAALVRARQSKKPYAIKRSMQQRALRVLQGWRLDPRFISKNGKPAELPFSAGAESFVALVRKYGGDVTPVAVWRELERMRAVVRTRTGCLRIASSVLRRSPNPEFVEVAQLLQDFAESVTDRGRADRPPIFRGFREARLDSPDQVALFKRTFARRGVALLDSVAEWIASQNASHPTGTGTSDQKTSVGLGVYVVEKFDQATRPRQERGR
ncbi:MAG: DUF6502 family protein [Gammaproteobacteria bacterium]